jgi:hypothetical protein
MYYILNIITTVLYLYSIISYNIRMAGSIIATFFNIVILCFQYTVLLPFKQVQNITSILSIDNKPSISSQSNFNTQTITTTNIENGSITLQSLSTDVLNYINNIITNNINTSILYILNEIESRNNTLQAKINSQDYKISTLENKINTLETTNNSLQTKINNMETVMYHLLNSGVLHTLERKTNKLEKYITLLTKTYSIKETNTNLEITLDNIDDITI